MTLLPRYLVRQNLLLLFTILLIGTGLFVLTDMFERLDNFLESGISGANIAFFFLIKIPTIISLILPAVFLMSLVGQINIMERNRELVALAAGGVPPTALFRFVLLYGLFWALAQILFSQVLGVWGERVSGRIWQEEVRGRLQEEAEIHGLWFTEGNRIVHIGTVWPAKKQGRDLTIYTLDKSGVGIDEIVKAGHFEIDGKGLWHLRKGSRLLPSAFSSEDFEHESLLIEQDLQAFQITAGSGIKPSHLTLGELSGAIAHLERSGSNVESLRTAWHGKLAYAASIMVMGVLALIVTGATPNIYKATVLSILIVFFYYGVNTMCLSMGEKGLLSPLVGAWFANALFFLGGLLWLAGPSLLGKISSRY